MGLLKHAFLSQRLRSVAHAGEAVGAPGATGAAGAPTTKSSRRAGGATTAHVADMLHLLSDERLAEPVQRLPGRQSNLLNETAGYVTRFLHTGGGRTARTAVRR